MSVSHVNKKGKIHGGKGAPKSTTEGKSIDANATNRVMDLGHNPPEVSPSATKNSRSQG